MSAVYKYEGKRSDLWGTPSELFNDLDDLYDFQWDLAANEKNSCCVSYFDEQDDSLSIDWNDLAGISWLNPPFSKAGQFFKKCGDSENEIIAIYKMSNLEAKVWQDQILAKADWVCFLRGRVNYEENGVVIPNVPFGSALIGYRVYCKVKHLGRVWHL